ncbi:hypothetical protein KVT40_007044 [Elsinoe batatas]|uniref:Uncharacterized protein n=1 Tax=Elsinoe batatas TaxID=2601811 RepID=A0A8K0KZ79_9PEZI|nr:hypothetical protein KVT40_007044 [Elsinoe batatas]
MLYYPHQISRHAQPGPHSPSSTCIAHRLRSRSPPVLLAPRHPSTQKDKSIEARQLHQR